MSIPEYVIQMIRRKAPDNCSVLDASTPVVSFGDFRKARVATLGINPSDREFLKPNGDWLSDAERRLATLVSLNAVSTETLTNEQVAEVFETSNNYFQKNPYRSWFGYLEKILSSGFAASYYDGSACHLDLSQWATRPKWKDLSEVQKQTLLDDGVPHLRAQLNLENITHVIVNGSSVWNEIKRSNLAEFQDVETLTYGKQQKSCTMRIGSGENTKFLGWTANIQSNPGANAKEFTDRLGEWLKSNT